MQTLGLTTPALKIRKKMTAVLGIAFTAGEDIGANIAVRLDTTTLKVLKMTAADQELLGITWTGAANGEQITVDVPYSHMVTVKASADIVAGAKVQFTAYDATNGVNVATTCSAAGKPVHGIALEPILANAQGMIGVLMSGDRW